MTDKLKPCRTADDWANLLATKAWQKPQSEILRLAKQFFREAMASTSAQPEDVTNAGDLDDEDFLPGEAEFLLNLMEDECLDVTSENHPIADSGDYEGVVYVHKRWTGPKGNEYIAHGETVLEAMRNAAIALGREQKPATAEADLATSKQSLEKAREVIADSLRALETVDNWCKNRENGQFDVVSSALKSARNYLDGQNVSARKGYE